MSEQTLFKLRVKYVKEGRLRYLGHLELAHTIERVVRRAGLPYAVTQGFSPHMRVGFSSALPVGTASECEWYDLYLTAYVPVSEALPALAAATPWDMRPVCAAYVDVRTPALTACITRAEYRIALTAVEGSLWTTSGLERALGDLTAKGAIGYLRGRKRKTLDLQRTLLGYRATPVADPAGAVLELDTYMDNEGSLRPEILLAALDLRLSDPARTDGDTDCGEEIVSTGTTSYRCFSRADIIRTRQWGEDFSL